MLCKVCQEIFQGDWSSKWYGHGRGPPLPHHETVDSLLNSIQNSCYICAKFWHHVREKGDETSILRFLRSWHARNERKPVTKYFFYKYRLEIGPGALSVHFCCWDDMLKDLSYYWFKLPKADYAKYATGEYKVASSTSASSCLDLAYQWLNEYTSSHAIYAKKSEDSVLFTPTRLLDIQHSGTAESNLSCRLVVTSETGVQGPYATVSHCWGAEPTETLTRSNFEAMKVGIIILKLSQTFRDAIVIARHLQVRYLWIDSLCIYSHRTTMKDLGTLRFAPQFFEGFYFTHLASRIWQYILPCL